MWGPMLTISAIPAFSDNYIWCLSDTASDKALIVDPGQAQPVLDHLAENGLTLDTILVTHHHPDHVGGVKELLSRFPDCRVTGPADSPYKGSTNLVHPGDEVIWEDITFQVLGVPGHTLDHIAYFTDVEVNGRPVLFCGDTLFSGGCGRLFEGTPDQMYHSLAKLAALPDDTLVCSGHEYTSSNARFATSVMPDVPAIASRSAETDRLRRAGQFTVPSTLALEKATNPFMLATDPKSFAALRAQKDVF